MGGEDKMAVRLTLPRDVAEKLRSLCHARGQTASDVVAEWVRSAKSPALENIQDIFRQARRNLQDDALDEFTRAVREAGRK